MKHRRILAVDHYASNDDMHSGLNNNDLIIGGSGTGKTGGYVIPNLHHPEGSFIITDTKGQLFRLLADDLKRQGYAVRVLDFVNPEQSCGYNPLRYIRDSPLKNAVDYYNTRDVVALAHALVPAHTVKDPFWDESARTVMAYLIGTVMQYLEPEDRNMASVAAIFQKLQTSQGRKFLESQAYKDQKTFSGSKFLMLQSVLDVDKTWGCICQFVSEALDPFQFVEIQHVFCSGDPSRMVDLQRIGREKTALFLNVSDTDRYADRLVNIVYTQAFQVLCRTADQCPGGRLPVPVRFILDDFASNVYIEDFDRILSIIRSRNISASVILQSITQLEGMYGHAKANTILCNCDHLLYLGGQDMETAKYIGSRINRTPHTVLGLPNEKAYLITRGQAGKLVDKIAPYSDCPNWKGNRSVRFSAAYASSYEGEKGGDRQI